MSGTRANTDNRSMRSYFSLLMLVACCAGCSNPEELYTADDSMWQELCKEAYAGPQECHASDGVPHDY